MHTPRISLLLVAVAVFLSAPLASAAEYRHAMAGKLIRREAFRAAVWQYNKSHRESPELGGPLAGLAFCHCRLGNLDEARGYATEAASRDPLEPMLHDAEACLAESAGSFDAAQTHMATAAELSVDPTREGLLGTFLMRHGQFDEAGAVVIRMREAGFFGRTSSALGVRHSLAIGDVHGAELKLLEMSADSGKHRGDMILETLVALSRDDLTGASIEPYGRFAPRTRVADRLLLLRAEASRRLGDLDIAEEQAGRCKQTPQEPLGWTILALIACDLGAFDDAEAALSQARQRWPLHPTPMLGEAVLRERQGRVDESIRLLELARERGIPGWDRHVEEDLHRDLGPGAR